LAERLHSRSDTSSAGADIVLGCCSTPVIRTQPSSIVALFDDCFRNGSIDVDVRFLAAISGKMTAPNQHLSTTEQAKSGGGEASGQR
jgi:hypothetical protein